MFATTSYTEAHSNQRGIFQSTLLGNRKEEPVKKVARDPDKMVFGTCVTIVPFVIFGNMQHFAMIARSIVNAITGIWIS